MPPCGRRPNKEFPVPVSARFTTELYDRIYATRADGESDARFIRVAVQREVERRERVKKKKEREK